MIPGDRDFSVITLKANASGSWLTVLRCPVEKETEVRAACLALRRAALSSLKFRLVDAEGGDLASLGCKRETWDWVEA